MASAQLCWFSFRFPASPILGKFRLWRFARIAALQTIEIPRPLLDERERKYGSNALA
jgi:hypothetical protein